MTEVMSKPPKRFEPGDKVYFKGGRMEGYPGYILAELKQDTPYEVVSYRTTSKSDRFPLQIRAGIYQPFVSEEYFMTNDEYWRSKDLNNKKFKKGDFAYYNGKTTGIFKKDTPYKITSVRDKDKHKADMSIELDDISKQGANVYSEDWLTEEEYIHRKFPTQNKIKDWADRGIATPVKKNDFKAGDVVYYDNADRHFPLHTPYRLWAEKDPKVFGMFLPAEGNNLLKGEWSQILKDYVDRDFISEEDYKKKYGGTSKPNPYGEEKRVGNYDSFIKSFKAGDKVYYVGDKIQRLKQDKAYTVQFYNPLTGLLKIDGDVCPSSDFISEKEYERLAMINSDIDKDKPSDKEPKSEVQLKMKIFKDTKSGKLQWSRPYPKNDEWYRSAMFLDNPKGSYLRFDVKRPADQWELHIYFHRNIPGKKAEDNSVEIRNYGESETLKGLIRKIETQIDSRREDDDDDQRYQYTYD